MKNLFIFFALCFSIGSVFGQAKGNFIYHSQNQTRNILSTNAINLPFNSTNDLIVSVKGLNNVKADTYVAIFNVIQAGKTATQVNDLLNVRIKKIENALKSKADVSFYVDMLSFVPVYDFEVERKIFSKTYNEVPKGFELKKNIHVEFKNPLFLDELINICAKSEVYDLVKVDYFSKDLEAEKKKLLEKAQTLLKEKVSNYQEVLGVDLTSLEKTMVDGFKVMYPVEMYKSYEAYNSSSFNTSQENSSKYSKTKRIKKNKAFYYQAITNKEFDFVLNPVIVEPVIQVMYQVKVRIKQKKATKETKKYFLVTPTGELKEIDIK
jgi:uncharacterized protein YggE